MGALDSLYLESASHWAPFYAIMQRELGNTATLLGFGNQKGAGLATATTWTGRKFHASGLSPVWTPSEALSAFDTPFDLKPESNWQGYAPVLLLNGTDEEADTPDAAYWTRTLTAFSVGAWVNLTVATGLTTILAKFERPTGTEVREWWFGLDEGRLFLEVWDETANANIGRLDATALSAGAWYFVLATYSGGTTSASVKLYKGDVQEDDSNREVGVFVQMQDTAALVRLGHILGTAGTASNFLTAKTLGGPWSPFFVQAESTAAQITNIYQEMRLGLGV